RRLPIRASAWLRWCVWWRGALRPLSLRRDNTAADGTAEHAEIRGRENYAQSSMLWPARHPVFIPDKFRLALHGVCRAVDLDSLAGECVHEFQSMGQRCRLPRESENIDRKSGATPQNRDAPRISRDLAIHAGESGKSSSKFNSVKLH